MQPATVGVGAAPGARLWRGQPGMVYIWLTWCWVLFVVRLGCHPVSCPVVQHVNVLTEHGSGHHANRCLAQTSTIANAVSVTDL